jgi:uncharacterized membrane protein YfhO
VTSVYRANYAFRAVYVEQGRHKVTLSFQPTSFYLGAALSVATLILLAVLAVLGLVRRRNAEEAGRKRGR